MKPKLILVFFNPILLIFILLMPLPACTADDQYQKLPITKPFELHKLNNQLELKFRVNKEQYYSFDLIFKCKKNDQDDCKRVGVLMGDSNAGYDLQLSKGEPIAVSLKIISFDDELSGASEYLMAEVGTQNLAISKSGGGRFVKEIYRLKLQSGRYKVIVTTLKDMPAFMTTSVDFRVGRAQVGK